MYVAYDDEGIIKTGTKRECLDSIVEWVEDEDSTAEIVYPIEDDRIAISNYFSREHHDDDCIRFSGFTIKPMEDYNA